MVDVSVLGGALVTGYVDRGTEGWTELRVHGVSGTPPAATLDFPEVVQVAGDGAAGFYRRRWEVPPPDADNGRRRLEAYSWGGLTSGSGSRALWLLLLPFMLVNVAYWAAPAAMFPSDRRTGWHRLHEAVQRLLSLTLTATFVLAVVVVSTDLIGWQCGNYAFGGGRCAGENSWLGFLSWSSLDTPGRHLAVTSVIPLGAVLLLWRLAQTSWAATEHVDVEAAKPVEIRTPLEDRALWNGKSAVADLRALHVTTAFALIGFLLCAAALRRPEDGLAGVFSGAQWASFLSGAVLVLLVVFAGLLVATVLILVWPGVAPRERPEQGKAPPREAWFRPLPRFALALVVAASVVLAVPGSGSGDGIAPAKGQLPWLGPTGTSVLLAQVALLLLLAWTSSRLFRRLPTALDREAVAWRGLGAAALAMLGWMLAVAFAAGLALWVAAAFGTPSVPGSDADDATTLTLPTEYVWAAALSVPLLVWFLAVGICGWILLVARRRETLRRQVEPIYRKHIRAEDRDRAKMIAKTWTTAQGLANRGELAVAAFLAGVAVLALAAVAGRFAFGSDLLERLPWLVVWGNVVITAFALALIYVGRQAYSKPQLRRSVGVLWDLGTFWPRATHPLAPPCYAERTVPDLLCRIEYLTQEPQPRGAPADPAVGAAPALADAVAPPQRLLLSCHSQGSIIGAAVLHQIRLSASRKVGFITYGSPLRRLYGRFFPAYFSDAALQRLRGYLTNSDGDTSTWRWRNLYRLSDPIGGWIFSDTPLIPPERDLGNIDRPLQDPLFSKAAGDTCWPATRGHSNYFADPAFTETTEAMRRGTLATAPPPNPHAPLPAA